jgi:hypothetical protein
MTALCNVGLLAYRAERSSALSPPLPPLRLRPGRRSGFSLTTVGWHGATASHLVPAEVRLKPDLPQARTTGSSR